MFLTIAIPTHNGESFIFETLSAAWRQVEKQQHQVEILVMDNASTDATESECTRAAKAGIVFRYFRSEFLRPPEENFHSAVLNSNSEYVWWLADDDIPLSGALEEVLIGLRTNLPSVLLLNFETFGSQEELNALEATAQDVSPLNQQKYKVWPRGESAYYQTGMRIFGLLSAICIHREEFLNQYSAPRPKPIYGFDFMYIIPLMMLSGTTVLMERSRLAFRQYEKRWITSNDYSQSLEIDFLVHPSIMQNLIFMGYGNFRMSRELLVRTFTLPFHILEARKRGFKSSGTFYMKLVKVNPQNVFMPIIGLFLWAPDWLLLGVRKLFNLLR